MKVYIRPLCVLDALTSYRWRNDPDIWKFTETKPDRYITKEIETEWIHTVLNDATSKRFAICTTEGDVYIGNVQLTDITNVTAQLHIFIGDKSYWGKGISTVATKLILQYAREILNLKKIFLVVNINNIAAIKTYLKNNFLLLDSCNEFYKMEVIL